LDPTPQFFYAFCSPTPSCPQASLENFLRRRFFSPLFFFSPGTPRSSCFSTRRVLCLLLSTIVFSLSPYLPQALVCQTLGPLPYPPTSCARFPLTLPRNYSSPPSRSSRPLPRVRNGFPEETPILPTGIIDPIFPLSLSPSTDACLPSLTLSPRFFSDHEGYKTQFSPHFFPLIDLLPPPLPLYRSRFCRFSLQGRDGCFALTLMGLCRSTFSVFYEEALFLLCTNSPRASRMKTRFLPPPFKWIFPPSKTPKHPNHHPIGSP